MVAVAALQLVCGCASSPEARARRALDAGDLVAAAAAYREAAQMASTDPDAWLALADVELRRGRASQARQALRRGQELAPTDVRMVTAMGESYELDRDYERAEAAYREAVRMQPDRPGPLRWLGVRLLRWGQAERATPLLERAIAMDPSHPETFNALGLARHRAGDAAGAERAFADGIERHPHHLRLRLGLAALMLRARRYDDALAVYEAAAAMHPDYAPLHVGRALVLDTLGRRTEALAAFELAAEVAEDPRPYLARLRGYRRRLAGMRAGE